MPRALAMLTVISAVLLLMPWGSADGSSRALALATRPGCRLQEEPERTNLRKLVKDCKKCHADVHAEWAETMHAKSWSDPVFQEAIKELEDKGESCAPCHAPRSLYWTGFGELPLARQKDRDLGVNCVTCHVEGNLYHGPFESSGHGGVEEEPEFLEPDLCNSCHGRPVERAEHDQGTSFASSPAKKEGKSCQSCHMTSVERKLVTKKSIKDKYLIGVQACRKHDFRGARAGDLVKDCAKMEAAFVKGEVVIHLEAKTGHGLPASSHRDVILTVEQFDGDGTSLDKATKVWRFPEGPVLEAGKRTPVKFPVKEGSVRLKATLGQTLCPVPGREAAVQRLITEATADR